MKQRLAVFSLLKALVVPLLALLAGSLFTGCLGQGYRATSLEEAEELSRRSDFPAAIESYRRHIAYRLSLPARPEWENPHLYLLLIGDLYLQTGDVEQALASYEEAEAKRVDSSLVADRYWLVARWYEMRGELAKALAVLELYRERDPMLIDLMRDRIARDLVAQEDAEREATPPPTEAVSKPK